ncbi:MAG: cupin domain-containing protein [Patulibacter sp.]|nr:cupin domain-containing protein [Patulibacter sp.]
MSAPFRSARLEPTAPDRINRFRSALGVTTFGINQIVLEPGQRMRIHRHRDQEEVFLVLAGELTVAFGPEEAHAFGVGELVRIAPETLRRMENRGRERLSLLALGGAGAEHQPRDAEAFAAWDGEPGTPADVPFPPDLPVAD